MEGIGRRTWELIWQAAARIHMRAAADGRSRDGAGDKILPSTKELVMEVVFSHPEGIMLKDVAGKVRRTPGAVSQIIESLVREGMIERVVSKHDRRAVTLHATTAGSRTRADFFGKADDLMRDIMRAVPQDEQTIFLKTLGHIVDYLAEGVPERGTAVPWHDSCMDE